MKRALIGMLLLCAGTQAIGGEAKKVLTPEAYDRWQEIVQPVLSDDGRWVAYTLEAPTGEAQLVVRATSGQSEYRVPRGVVPRALSPETWRANLALGRPTHFVGDSRAVFFTLVSSHSDSPTSSCPGTSEQGTVPGRLTSVLAVLSLTDGQVKQLAPSSAFKLDPSGRYLAYEPVEHEPATECDPNKRAGAASRRSLVVRDLIAGNETHIAEVTEFVFDSKGRYLAYTVHSEQPQRSGAYVRRLSDGHVSVLHSGAGQYRSLTFDEAGEQLAFLFQQDGAVAGKEGYGVYYASGPTQPAQSVVPPAAFSSGLRIYAPEGVKFTRTGNALVFALGPLLPNPPKPGPGEARFELRHWQEPTPLPQGRLDASRIQAPWLKVAQSYLAVYHLRQRRWVQLGDEQAPRVLLTDDARHAVGIKPHRLQNLWDRWSADVYLIDAHTGARRLFRRGLKPVEANARNTCHTTPTYECLRLFLSPGGRYVLYFEAQRWWSVELATGKQVDLTGSLLPHIRFDHTTRDTPAPSSQTVKGVVEAIAGWTADDQRVWLYGPRDIWEVDPAGRAAPRNLTAGVGERENIVFRLLEDFSLVLAPELGRVEFLARSAPFLDPSRPLLLMAMDLDTMASGIWRLRGQGEPQKLLMREQRITPIARAKQAEQYLLSLQSYSQYPDLWVAPGHFGKLTRVSEANPQQREYLWGSAELVHFTSDFGTPLKGILYKPEGFNPNKQYPLIVSLYQMSSRYLHLYASPKPLVSSPLGSGWTPWPEATSRGYLRLVPDVFTAAAYPGPSAVAAVVPAVRALIDRGFVDPERIALTGASFGAFETLYILTQTDLFRCAIADAGQVNLLSRYGTGVIGQALLEGGQTVLGGSPWERPWVYLLNSALLQADRVRTPVLMMYNDADMSIPIGQGLEFFTALQRHGREAYLVNYHGAGHGLGGWHAAQLDWTRRVQEFLDHYLKDAPQPAWMQPPVTTPAAQSAQSGPQVTRTNASRDLAEGT